LKDLNATLIRAIPKTGRQHQIRVHMFHVEHSIIGDPIYGQTLQIGANYLDGKLSFEERIRLCKASRVLLHAQMLSFKYKDIEYILSSNYDATTEFEKVFMKENL
jgi:23S rRNA pseudouridine1911/1915/1917 synthase